MLADSHPLGEVLYRKWHMYDMAWGEDRKLENFTVCGAPYGGPIALMQNQKTLQAEEKENILLYTSAGKMLSEISWDGGNLLSMGWSDHENLIAVTDRGKNSVPGETRSINIIISDTNHLRLCYDT